MKMLIKKNLLAFAILLATATTGFSQAKVAATPASKAVVVKTAVAEPTQEEVVSKLIVRKWHIAYLEQAGKKQRLPLEDIDANWTAFKKDGTYKAADDGDQHDGKWSYNHADKTLTAIDRDGVNKFKIIKVTSKELVVTTLMEGKLTTVGMINQ